VERDPGQDLEDQAALHAETLDGVEAVELGPAGGDLGQVPACRRGWSADPVRGVERTAPLEDAADRADRGDRQLDAGQQFAADGDRAVLTEDARLAQGTTGREDAILERGIGPVAPVRRSRAIRPDDPIEALVSGSLEPALDRPQADAEGPRPRSPRATGPDRRHDRPSRFGRDLPGVFRSREPSC